MKIFSNFDTNLHKKQYAHYCARFGEANVLFVRRDTIYIVFKFYLPLVFILLTISLTIWGIVSIEGGLFATLIRGILWFILAASVSYFCWISIGKFIDYYMDYMIVTPKDITLYDQAGIFRRSSNSLDITKIKTVSVRQNSFWGSLFNYGSIVFFAEGDALDQTVGQIRLNYITNPRRLKSKISRIITLGQQQYGAPSEEGLMTHAQKLQQDSIYTQ